MSAQAYTTRDEAALPRTLIETMAQAAYEATRTPSFPAWREVGESYRRDMHKSVAAGLKAAISAGLIEVRGNQ